MRRLAIALLALCTALLALVPAAHAAAREQKIGAAMVIATKETSSLCARCGPNGTPEEVRGCNYAIFVQFPDVTGASSYNVVVRDNLVKATRNFVGPPFNDNHEGYKTPAGSHWFGGLTGGGGSTCPTDPYEGGRFEILKAVAIFDGKPRITGTVRDAAGVGIPGVQVRAKGPRSASATTGPDGRYAMKVKKGRYSVSTSQYCAVGVPGCARSRTIRVNATERVDFRVKREFARNIEVFGEQGALDPARVGKPALFKGTEWDAEGGPITVSWGGRTIKRVPAADTFEGSVRLPTFARDTCRDDLVFSQDGERRAVALRGRLGQAVAYVNGKVTADGERRLKHNDAVCEGEIVRVPRDGTFVGLGLLDGIAEKTDDSAYSGLRVVAPAEGIDQHGNLLTTRLRLGFLPRKPVLRFPADFVGDITRYDTTGRPDLAVLPRNRYPDGLDFRGTGGYALSKTSLSASDLICSGPQLTLLYVMGTFGTTKGGVRGESCVIAATGDIRLTGPIRGRNALLSPTGIELRGR